MDSNHSGNNWTLGERDLFGGEDTESDAEQFNRRFKEASIFLTVVDYTALIGAIGVIIFDIYLIVIICRNKKLKSLNTSKYVLNYAIFNILTFLTAPAYSLLLALVGLWVDFNYNAYCFTRQLESLFDFALFLCAFGLGVEWLIKIYFDSKLHPIILKIPEHSIKIIYLICFIDLVTDGVLCYEGQFYIPTAFAGKITFFLLVILISVCQFLASKRKASSKKKFSLTIATVMMLCWLPAFIYHLAEDCFHSSYTLRFIIIVTYFIPRYLAYGSIIVIVLALRKLNKYYKVAFTRSCSKSVTTYSGDDEGFEDSEDEASENVNVLAKDEMVL